MILNKAIRELLLKLQPKLKYSTSTGVPMVKVESDLTRTEFDMLPVLHDDDAVARGLSQMLDDTRGAGNTLALVKTCMAHDGILIVPTEGQARIAHDYARSLGGQVDVLTLAQITDEHGRGGPRIRPLFFDNSIIREMLT